MIELPAIQRAIPLVDDNRRLTAAGWQDEYQILDGGSVTCKLRLRIGGEWITKMDVGSQSEQPDDGDKVKAAFSDALKRAAVKFGIGRFLYRLPAQWCDYDPKARKFLTPPRLPGAALPPAAKTQQPADPSTAQPQPDSALLARIEAARRHLGIDRGWPA